MDLLWGIEKLTPALVGFLGAWLGSRWGVTKFRREKHWESKVKTYETIIHCFEEIAFWGRISGSDAYCGVTVGKDSGPEQFHQAMRKIAQLEVVGAIYISIDFRSLCHEKRVEIESLYIDTIEDLKGEGEHKSYYGFADLALEISGKAYTAVEALNHQASRDIGVEKNWLLLRLKAWLDSLEKDWLMFRKNIS